MWIRWPIVQKEIPRFVILCICWDSPNEKTGLGQLLNISIALNLYGHYKVLETVDSIGKPYVNRCDGWAVVLHCGHR